MFVNHKSHTGQNNKSYDYENNNKYMQNQKFIRKVQGESVEAI